MTNYKDHIGKIALWIKQGKKGKFMSGRADFTYNMHPVTSTFIIFKNEKKSGNQPDYKGNVTDCFPAKARDVKEKSDIPEKEEIPF